MNIFYIHLIESSQTLDRQQTTGLQLYWPTSILAYSYIGLQLYWLGLGSHTGEPMVLEAVVRSPTNMAAAKIVAVDFIDFIKYSRLTSTK